MMPRQNAPNPYTVNTISFTVKPGRLVLFPAWLRHAVPAKRSRIDRISFAFNLMFRNYVEDSSPALWRGTVPVDPAAAKSE
jgi:ectoine hydroxylase-related dioxygenase (phytanoyl-CoA dioxygenase family)